MTRTLAFHKIRKVLRVFKVFTFRKSLELRFLYASHIHMQKIIQ
jgi:hypothetical protein